MIVYLIYKDDAYPLYKGDNYRLGKESICDVVLPLEEEIFITVKDNTVNLLGKEYEIGVYHISLSDDVSVKLIVLEDSQYFLLPKNSLYLSNEEEATISLKESSNEILFNFCELSKIEVLSNDDYFINGHRKFGKQILNNKDILVFESGIVLSIQDQLLMISSIFEINTDLIKFYITKQEDRGREFHRSPRIILRAPEGKVTIAPAPTDDELNRQSLIKLLITPFAMIIFTFLIYFFSRSSSMVFLMMGMSVITIGTSIHSYFSDKKNHIKKQKQKLKDYLNYLDTKYEELSAYKEEQVESLLYHYPDSKNLLDMAKKIDRRIYEKTPYHFDFLTYRLGTGEIKTSFQIEYTEAELTKYNKEAGDKVKELISYYQFIDGMPIENSIGSPIGYIGNRKVVIEQLQQLMMQIATFQSYHDVEFIPIFREEELELWNFSRWLPHTKLKAFNNRGFIYNQRTRDQLLTSLYQIIKDRKLDYEQDKGKEKEYLPRYILLITDLSLLLDHNIMEYINEDLSHLGIHYIFVEEVIESLSEHVKTVIDYRGDKKAKLILQDGRFIDKEFIPLPVISKEDKDDFARNMAGIVHIQTLRNSIPDSITFLEMYGVSHVEELNILKRWSENETYQTMAVPLGVRGRDDILYLNLHEKAHGPHGLIAGTTGSGKSELVQSYILSLAVNYHPYEVAFLLIDYKGGGMANLFSNLPHVVGTITNLDGNQANRALVSIKAELKKRQRIFLENDVNHINQYTKLFKEGKVKEPLPHLLIISDEFAELKANQPDFMDELVSTARIGRSLGVKLILATQKPSGVVNDQIWSNSKFKIALKVQDVADSREVIKTPDAAEITQTGRAYLQVGNNEIYELFQSAWSGADYNPDGKNNTQKEITIYEITSNGQYSPINKDLSGFSKQKDVKALPTELDAIVESAHILFERLNIPKVASPWLPPLEEKIYSKDLQSVDFREYWNKDDRVLKILMGYQDIPERQEQSPLYFNMDKTGHILLVGSPGFGKSTFLRTFATDVMRKQTPKEAHLYLYDFGASGLISMSDFPHVADYFTLDEMEKILKSLRRLNQMVKERKKALSNLKATNLSQYNQLSEDKFPTVFILIDGFDSVMDAPFSEVFYEILNVIARDGASLGIYLVVTLSRLNAMRLQLQSNFKTKISLFLFDNSDLSGVVGRSNISLDEIKGRAVTKIEDIIQFQIVLPYDSEQYGEYIESVNREILEMKEAYTGELPPKIPMLPEKVVPSMINFDNQSDKLIFGLYRETVEPASFYTNHYMSFITDNVKSLAYYYSILEYHLKKWNNLYRSIILDSSNNIPVNRFPMSVRATTNQEVREAILSILSDLEERIKNPDNYPNVFVIVSDVEMLAYDGQLTEEEFKKLLLEGPKYGITLIFVGLYKSLIGGYHDFVKIHKQFATQVFMGMRITDQDYVRFPYISNEKTLKGYQGYKVTLEDYNEIQLIECED